MKKNTKILIGLLILALIGGVIFYGVSEMGAGKARKIEKRQKVANETYIDRKTIDKRSRLPKEVKQKVEFENKHKAAERKLRLKKDLNYVYKTEETTLEKETYIDPKTIDKKSRLLKETTKEIGTSKEETQEEYNKWLEKKESCEKKQLNCLQKAYNELWPMGMVLSPNAINACVQEEDSSCSEFAVCKNKGLQPFSFDIENQKGVTIVHPNLQEFEIGAYCKDKK